MNIKPLVFLLAAACLALPLQSFSAPKKKPKKKKKPAAQTSGEFTRYAIYQKSAPRPKAATPAATSLPLVLKPGTRISLIGNTLFDRSLDYGYLESLIHQAHPNHQLIIRNLSWSADAITLQPRPANFADTEQHLTHEKADVIFAAYGYNESFAGQDGLASFQSDLRKFVTGLKNKAYNATTAPQVVLLSPIANENIAGVPAADMNNANIAAYTKAMAAIAAELKVGFVNLYDATAKAMVATDNDLTANGAHLNDAGYQVFGAAAFEGIFGKKAPNVKATVREAVIEKNKQYFRRFRPLNTFYYTGGRNRSYGYLDFLPAMRNFEIMTANRDAHIWALVQGKQSKIDDSNVPPLPDTKQSRGANEWLKPTDELSAFKVDPRFDVTIFADENKFPDLACPIQMRWDSRGRLWVSCSTTYPHVYPGNEPNDKIIILEDIDGDGKADTSKVFADNLNVPLSFEFANGGLFVSEEPHLTFIKDTDGDDKADHSEIVLTGFGCEDSHHALHDFHWTPDGDLIFRESVFHHTQVETAYGPVRQKNSGWFRYTPRTKKLISFGTYSSTNPWGVTFDDWGQHMASHPVFASAFHALDPTYPEQHPRPSGLQAYSGVCGKEFVDFPSWPKEMQGNFIKVRYKPTNRVEIHQWIETPYGYEEKYVSDLIFSKNLSFIPVDLRYGPRGAMYVCDWYNPVKGHAQYSLRDPRRDRISGRIFRIMPKNAKAHNPPKIANASIKELLDNLKLPQYRYRYWSKRELRDKDPAIVKPALDKWIAGLDKNGPRYRHHQTEANWLYRGIGSKNLPLLEELLTCENHNARAAATRQLRYLHSEMPNGDAALLRAANDTNGLVRLEAAIAGSYVGTTAARDAVVATLNHSTGKHLAYAIRTALGSKTIKRHLTEEYLAANPKVGSWMKNFMKEQKVNSGVGTANSREAEFDAGAKHIVIKCVPERMMFDVKQFKVKAGQKVRLDLLNPDATAHNLVIIQAGAEEEVGTAANLMAQDPSGPKKHFIPESNKIIAHTKLLQPESGESLRFTAPTKKGKYPYLCTFPGHWVIMRGIMIVE